MYPKEEKKPVKAASLSTPLSEEVATTGSAEVKDTMPSLLNSIINLISILVKILGKVHELLMGDRVYMTHVNPDGTAYSCFVAKEEVKKSGYDIDWRMDGRSEVFKKMIDDHLIEEYFPPDSHIRGLRVSRTFNNGIYNEYKEYFVLDAEFFNLPFVFSREGQRFNENSWRQFKKRQQVFSK